MRAGGQRRQGVTGGDDVAAQQLGASASLHSAQLAIANGPIGRAAALARVGRRLSDVVQFVRIDQFRLLSVAAKGDGPECARLCAVSRTVKPAEACNSKSAITGVNGSDKMFQMAD